MAVGYVRTVGPWLVPIVVLGVLLGWLRRYAARHGYVLVLSLGPTQQMRFGLQSALPILLVPVVVWMVAQRLAATQQLDITIDPAGGVSAVDTLRRGRRRGVGRRDGMAAAATVSTSAALEMVLAVRTVLQTARDLESARIGDVAADTDSGTVHIRGQFEDAEQQRRVQQLCRDGGRGEERARHGRRRGRVRGGYLPPTPSLKGRGWIPAFAGMTGVG